MKGKMRSRFLLLVLAAFLGVAGGGCWDRHELNEINLIMGVAQDYEKEGKSITVMGVVAPQKDAGSTDASNEAHYSVFSGRGRSLADADESLAYISTRRNFWSHCDLILVSREQAEKEGVKEMLEFFSRDYARRLTATLLVTEGKAKEMFETEPIVSHNPAQELLDIEGNIERTGRGVHLNIYQFLAEAEGVTGISLGGFYRIKEAGGKSGVSGQGKKKTANGMAVFREYKMIGCLTPEETVGLNWLRENIRQGMTISFPLRERGPADVSVEVREVKTKIEPQLEEAGSRVQVDIEIKCELKEFLSTEELTQEEVLAAIEEACSREVARVIKKSWEKCQKELHADAFRLGDRFANKYKRVLKLEPREWQEIFSAMELKLTVRSSVNSSGLRRNSPQRG